MVRGALRRGALVSVAIVTLGCRPDWGVANLSEYVWDSEGVLDDFELGVGERDLALTPEGGSPRWVDCYLENEAWRCGDGRYFAVLETGTWTVDVCVQDHSTWALQDLWVACSGSSTFEIYPETETVVTVELDQCYHGEETPGLEVWEYRERTGCRIE